MQILQKNKNLKDNVKRMTKLSYKDKISCISQLIIRINLVIMIKMKKKLNYHLKSQRFLLSKSLKKRTIIKNKIK